MTDKKYQPKYQDAVSDEPVDPEVVEASQGYAPRALFVDGAKADLSKMTIPRLRLAQGMTSEVTDRKAQIGQFVLTGFPAKDDVVLVPLGAVNIRSYAPNPKEAPQCHAPGPVLVPGRGFTLHGIGDPGIVCDDCPLGKWGPKNEKTGRGTPPPCKEGVALRAYSITHRTLVDFQFMGRSQSKGTFIQSQLIAWGEGQFAVRVSSTATKNDRGQWYEPEVEMMEEVPEDHRDSVERWLELHKQSVVSPEQAAQYFNQPSIPAST